MDKALHIAESADEFGFLSKQSRMLFDYFKKIQPDSGEAIPHRDSFDPMKVPRLLPNILMMELRSEQECVFRLVGNATIERSGTNPQGMNYFDLLPEKIKASCVSNMFAIFRQPCASTGLQVESYTNGEAATVEVTSFPFMDKDGLKLVIATATEVFVDELTLPREGSVSLDHWPAHRFIDIGAGLPERA